MVNIESIRTKLANTEYYSLKEQREFIKWCISRGLTNDKILESFKAYSPNESYLTFRINELRPPHPTVME